MPQLVSVRVRNGRGRRLRLWVPILPVLLILSPVLLLVLALAAVACLVWRINPVRALHATWRLLCALTGTRIEIEQSRTAVLVNIR
ncbi:hypothetical protein GA0074695_4046 [Micromonospora viridifaciens]|uniref:Uncharacterized protein n=1 Tax=Micromonospora viridifaciens TaxID=1881 RepID=A0A1C4YB49_MICVI|nr:hypothetical protein [Micromonospora viridifaciens]SCF17934.1 hypothetical protein GA0074695_4046 [Micromonospora viridifaciens]